MYKALEQMIRKQIKLVAHAFYSSIQGVEAGEFLIWRPVWSTEEFQDSLGYTEKTSFRKD